MTALILLYFYAILLIFPLFRHEFSSATTVPNTPDDAELLLKMARDYRSGSNNLERNLPRSIHFYQYAIEKAKGKALTQAVTELLNLLDEGHPVQSKYSKWDLLLASATRGNETAQHKLASALAVGIYENSLVPMDITRSLLLEYVAALSGSPEASLGMGYRYANGIGLAQSCEKALPFYEYAANIAVDYIEESNGFVPVPDKTRLSDSLEHSFRLLKESSNELTDYYAHLADNGESSAATLLGNIYTTGSKNLDPDEDMAIYYLKVAMKLQSQQSAGLLGYLLAKKHHYKIHPRRKHRTPHKPAAPKVKKEVFHERDDTPAKISSLLHSSKASDLNGVVGLGFIYYHGIGVEVNQTRALEYFQKALPSHPDAGYYIGEIIMKQQSQKLSRSTALPPQSGWRNHEVTAALHAYSTSAQLGSVLSQHRLAQMHNYGWGGVRSCEAALSGFRAVAERGPWSIELNEANRDFNQGNFPSALRKFVSLAAIGYETAQYNAAYILLKCHCPSFSLTPSNKQWLESVMVENSLDPESVRREFSSLNSVTSINTSDFTVKQERRYALKLLHSLTGNQTEHKDSIERDKTDCDIRALSLSALSAAQGNSDAFVQIGDFYYYRFEKYNQSHHIAATYYQKAADLHNTQAIFNLGLMHEIGDGVEQDFHLAKRYYDMAAEVDAKARTPRDIALMMLEGHKSILSFIHSEFVTKFYGDPRELEALFYSTLRQAQYYLREFDRMVQRLSHVLKHKVLSFSSSSTTTKDQAEETEYVNSDQVIVEDYLPESTKFHVFQVSEKFRQYYESSFQLLKLLSTELQRDFRMKEEEATLFIVLTFFLLGLLILQLLVFFCTRYAQYRQRH